MTAIVILNWNGADDTLACLQSLAKADGEFVVFVVDNGSSDDSIQRIATWIDEHKDIDVRLVPLDKNYGFARGNNKGLEVARKISPDSYLLLNNDTEVCPDFLEHLLKFADDNPEYKLLTPKINFFSDKGRVWNCGGKLFFGFRKYFYAGRPETEIKENKFIEISFVTGCALFFTPGMLDSEGKIFTERFFFGEEDFELSLRMKKNRQRMACVLDSQIYHKVGASIGRSPQTPKIYLHYLNRLINVRLHFNALRYFVWLLLNIPLLLSAFYKSSKSISLTLKLVRSVISDSYRKDGVTQEDFRNLLIEHKYFKFKL